MRMKSSLFWTQIAKPAGLFLVLTLGLSACGGDPKPKPTPTPGQANKILGQLKPWTEGSAKKVMPENTAIEKPTPAMKADINTQGQFDYNLFTFEEAEKNDPTDSMPFQQMFSTCEGLKLSGHQGIKVIALNTLITDTGQQYNQKSKNSYTYRWLVNKDTNIQISAKDCTTYKKILPSDLQLKKGWNVIQFTTDFKTSSFKVVKPPTVRMDWSQYSRSTLQVMGLPANFHYPWLSAEELQNRR